ncbi:hypothetical protein JTE90_007164 [Oedothorax gibbosus]|uniref:EGF-like domain-containing protein n=1 Tax=Oedothorax gibbosus TaxID=931172 RepID=A0AAV6UW72_9ARAC|nr:hypothetical protein JTE90_007164 [Oedothorax gibbosus]
MEKALSIDDTVQTTMNSIYCYFAMVLIAIYSISSTGTSINRNVRKNKSWYPPLRDQSEESEFLQPGKNINEKSPTRKNIHLNNRYSQNSYKESGEIPALNFYKKDLKYPYSTDDQDSNPHVVKRNSKYKIYKNSDNDDPDLNFLKKDQKMQESDGENSDINFFKKDSERQADSNPLVRYRSNDDYPAQRYPSNIEDYYDSGGAEDNKNSYETTTPEDTDDYVEADEEEENIPKPLIMAKVKRQEELTPLVIGKIAEDVEKKLAVWFGDAKSNPCTNCTAAILENDKLKSAVRNETARDLLPANACDRWFHKNRTCWMDRNIGDTITFVLSFGEGPKNAQVQWRQEFHLLNSKKTKHFDIDSEKPMWNVVIGSRGHEFRISPITETDVDSNFFSAIVMLSETKKASLMVHHRVNFRIKLIPIDQGFVYPGETIVLNMRRTTLPRQGLLFKWFMENDGEKSTLPSNMKLSPTGEVLHISELRQEQRGIITCAVFTNLGFFATKQRYLLNVSGSIGYQDSGLLFVPSTKTSSTTAAPAGAGKRKRRSLNAEDNLEQALINLNSNRKQNKKQDLNSSDNPNDGRQFQSFPFNYPPAEGPILSQLRNNNFRTNFPNNNFESANRRTRRQNFPVGVADDDEMEESNRNGNKLRQIAMAVNRVAADERADDNISKLIASCSSDLQCAPDAICVPGAGFCRCNTGYQGNGLFCWANAHMSSSVVEENVANMQLGQRAQQSNAME